jgi:hypothetical protein
MPILINIPKISTMPEESNGVNEDQELIVIFCGVIILI